MIITRNISRKLTKCCFVFRRQDTTQTYIMLDGLTGLQSQPDTWHTALCIIVMTDADHCHNPSLSPNEEEKFTLVICFNVIFCQWITCYFIKKRDLMFERKKGEYLKKYTSALLFLLFNSSAEGASAATSFLTSASDILLCVLCICCVNVMW